jgi:hypothetical protein
MSRPGANRNGCPSFVANTSYMPAFPWARIITVPNEHGMPLAIVSPGEERPTVTSTGPDTGLLSASTTIHRCTVQLSARDIDAFRGVHREFALLVHQGQQGFYRRIGAHLPVAASSGIGSSVKAGRSTVG